MHTNLTHARSVYYTSRDDLLSLDTSCAHVDKANHPTPTFLTQFKCRKPPLLNFTRGPPVKLSRDEVQRLKVYGGLSRSGCPEVLPIAACLHFLQEVAVLQWRWGRWEL